MGWGATSINETNFCYESHPDTGSIAQPGGLKPSMPPTELWLLPVALLEIGELTDRVFLPINGLYSVYHVTACLIIA